ncbi:Signal peptidase I [Levilactobacillus zymae DSM 19395]|uniref:signal peptidase I n=1 Tax=Levilactobacillus zymae TaxID=267363 RepID=UPI0006F0A590|nr:signal peptidase I [Levilactobacillus zymae]KRL15064.1 Signal peptidase I [Levilactobacillus zymae DSM 19395]QFR61644.1 signal peptidase I [Levilactobacillus zymae]
MKLLRSILSWVVPIVVAVILVVLVRTYLFEVVRVSGDSMTPNLADKERMIVVKPLAVKRLSVIVFDAYGEDPNATPGTNYVKRVIGRPGDKVVSKNGYIYVNNRKINQSFISPTERTAGTGDWTLSELAKEHHWKYTGNAVPKGHYFVLGDHRSVSEDSRAWGYVDAHKVMGVVKIPFWQTTATYRHNVNDLAQ